MHHRWAGAISYTILGLIVQIVSRQSYEQYVQQHILLATDDDPRRHPFAFPLLDQLGPLGRVLGSVLQAEVATRPTVTELRQQLETLLAPAGSGATAAAVER